MSVAPSLSKRAVRRRARWTEFLFDPEVVMEMLAGLPHLAAEVGDPHDEGKSAEDIPGARKSTRELVRVLGNAHYQHLSELLSALDSCLEAGFTQSRLLKTRVRGPFAEAIAELQAADHFRRLGCRITDFDTTKGVETTADILVELDHVTAVVEVYCPSAWPNLSAYTEVLNDRVKNLDHGTDFPYRIDHHQLQQFDRSGRLVHLSPGKLGHALTEGVRLTAVESLLSDLQTTLGEANRAQASYEFSAFNFGTTVELTELFPASSPVPARAGFTSEPGLTMPRPEHVFARIVSRVIAKLRDTQAVGLVSGALPILAVEMSQSGVVTELRHAFYRSQFEESLAAMNDLCGYGAVVFCEAVDWQKPLASHFIAIENDIADMATVKRFFP